MNGVTWKSDVNKRSVAILRVSSAAQRDNTSHDIQEKDVSDYCEKHGLSLVKTYRLSESAKDSEGRKQYHAAIEFALSQGVRHLLFYMQDRESRNLRDLEDNEQLIKADKIVLHYVHDNKVLDRHSSEADFLSRDFQGVINKQYSRVLAAKVKDALVLKAENGWFPFGRAPLGYAHLRPKDENGKEIKRAPTTIIVDPNPKNVAQIRREFELKAKGYSLDQIRETIIAEGFIQKGKEKEYHRTVVDWHLKNKFYYGKFDWDGKEYIGKHPIIIPQNILDAVALGGRFREKAFANTAEDALFTGWLRCANEDCGCQITYEKRKKVMKTTGETKVYDLYRCANSKKVHKSLKGMYASESDLWTQFEGAVEEFSLTKEMAKDISDALEETHQKARKRIMGEMDGYRAALRELDVRNNMLFDMLMSKTIEEADYRRQLKRIEEDRQRITNLLEEAQLSIHDAAMKAAKSIFELATEATSFWKSASRLERLALLKRVSSNQVLDGSTLRYDLKKPFAVLAEIKQEGIKSG